MTEKVIKRPQKILQILKRLFKDESDNFVLNLAQNIRLFNLLFTQFISFSHFIIRQNVDLVSNLPN